MLFVTPKRTFQPRSGHGTSGKPVAMKLIESVAGRCPGPGVPSFGSSGSSRGSLTSGTDVYSAPTTEPAAGVIATSHQWPVVMKRGAQNVTTPGCSGVMTIG